MKQNQVSKTKTILLAAFTAGTLDMLAAIIVYTLIMKVVTVNQLLHGIAAGLFGQTVFGSEWVMALTGLLLHYIIAFCFAGAYFFAFRYISFLKKNALISGLLYGIFVWAVMNLVVVPLSQAYHAPLTWPGFLRSLIILMICIGLPVSFITAAYYKKITAW